jgi:hypothetical protein
MRAGRMYGGLAWLQMTAEPDSMLHPWSAGVPRLRLYHRRKHVAANFMCDVCVTWNMQVGEIFGI